MGEESRKRRKRILVKKVVEPSVDSALNYGKLFQPNAASKNAKHVKSFQDCYELEFWVDKHHVNRNNFGDDNGSRGEIGEEVVEQLIENSLSHLIYYSSTLEKLFFVNIPPPKPRRNRIVLTKVSNTDSNLNVVVEFNFLDNRKYEVTVITAMREDDFIKSDGQFTVEFHQDGSTLYRFTNNNNIEIATI
tara:strand:+ start:520 stop:1089 length:570 start_codon:yes stop_codon:yes gene_type:complete